jgi:hypothetical protein
MNTTDIDPKASQVWLVGVGMDPKVGWKALESAFN